jgi:hypothetical protein
MTINTTRFFNHLMRRRVLIWVVTLILIAGFTGATGAILWSVRMNVTYRAEIRPQAREGWDGSITAIIPATAFQVIQKGEAVMIIPDDGEKEEGVIRSVATGAEEVKLKINANYQPEEETEALITLRAERLISAFLR